MSPTAPTPVPPPITAEQLPDDVATLKRMILELLVSMQEQQRDNEALQHRLEQLLRRLYGPRSERIDPNQLLLFEEPVAGQDPPGQHQPQRPRRRSPSGVAGPMAAVVCRTTCPISPSITNCRRPSGCARAVASCASTSVPIRVNNSTTGRRRCW